MRYCLNPCVLLQSSSLFCFFSFICISLFSYPTMAPVSSPEPLYSHRSASTHRSRAAGRHSPVSLRRSFRSAAVLFMGFTSNQGGAESLAGICFLSLGRGVARSAPVNNCCFHIHSPSYSFRVYLSVPLFTLLSQLRYTN